MTIDDYRNELNECIGYFYEKFGVDREFNGIMGHTFIFELTHRMVTDYDQVHGKNYNREIPDLKFYLSFNDGNEQWLHAHSFICCDLDQLKNKATLNYTYTEDERAAFTDTIIQFYQRDWLVDAVKTAKTMKIQDELVKELQARGKDKKKLKM